MDERPEPEQRWRKLPEPVPFDQQVISQPASDATDPEMGRNADQDWMLRYS